MCNNKHLFIHMSDYMGIIKHVKLGNGLTKASIDSFCTIKVKVASNKVICPHSIIYVPNLNVSIFRVKNHLEYIECYEHSDNNMCRIAFQKLTVPVEDKNELEFMVQPSTYKSTSAPYFDDDTVILYTARPPHAIYFDQPDYSNLHEVTISLIIKTKPVNKFPKRKTQQPAGYDINSQKNISIDPDTYKFTLLGI